MTQMRSTTVYLTESQDAALKRISEETGVPVAEMIRQSINLYLELHDEEYVKPTDEEGPNGR